MNVIVEGHQIDVGDALRTHVEDELAAIAEKYFPSAIEAQTVFSREAHLFRAEVKLNAGRRIHVQATGEATDPYPAFEQCAERLAKRLRRYKRRLQDHHNAPDAAEAAAVIAATARVIEPRDEDDATAANGAANGHAPMVIAEMETPLETMSVSEAVMRLDLTELPAMLFRNGKDGALNMVYRRTDGNIGWVEPPSGQ